VRACPLTCTDSVAESAARARVHGRRPSLGPG
jgi:hypothetical protein